MMKNLPACQTCVNSGFLCSRCEKKFDNGDITEFDLDLAKFLLELEEREESYNFLKDVSFYKAIDYEDVVILVVGNRDKLRITPKLHKLIKKTYEIDEIILIEKTSKPRPVVEALIAPNKVLSINEIFLATGDIEFKAILREDDQKKMLFTKEELEELVFELTGNVTRVEFQ